MADKKSGGGKKIGRWKRTPSNVRYKAQDRCGKNKRRKASHLVLQAMKKRRHIAQRVQAGKPTRGTARREQRDETKGQWLISDSADNISLAEFMRRGKHEKACE